MADEILTERWWTAQCRPYRIMEVRASPDGIAVPGIFSLAYLTQWGWALHRPTRWTSFQYIAWEFWFHRHPILIPSHIIPGQHFASSEFTSEDAFASLSLSPGYKWWAKTTNRYFYESSIIHGLFVSHLSICDLMSLHFCDHLMISEWMSIIGMLIYIHLLVRQLHFYQCHVAFIPSDAILIFYLQLFNILAAKHKR